MPEEIAAKLRHVDVMTEQGHSCESPAEAHDLCRMTSKTATMPVREMRG